MSRVPIIGVPASPTYPARIRNTDLRQASTVLRMGEFSRTRVEMRGLPGIAGQVGVLAAPTVSRGVMEASKRLGLDIHGRLTKRLSCVALIPPGAFRGCTALVSHGTFPVGIALPPLLWNPGFTPDDVEAAAGTTLTDRADTIRAKRAYGRHAAGIYQTSQISVDLWNERVGVPSRDRVFTIPYFLPSLPLSTEPVELAGHDGKEFRVFFVGRQARRKNLPRVIEACRILTTRTTTPISLTIVSNFADGPVDVSAPFIQYKGSLPNKEVLALMRQSDVLCIPSVLENGGVGYVEGIGRGLAVIAPDFQVHRSMFGNAAVYAKADRAEAIADQLERLMDPAVRRPLAQAGADLYRAKYAPDVVATTTINAALAVAS